MNSAPTLVTPFLPGTREAWGAWLRGRGRGLVPSTIARWRSTLQAALGYGAHEYEVATPILRAIRGAEVERIAYLTTQQEGRLLAAYSRWAASVMVTLRPACEPKKPLGSTGGMWIGIRRDHDRER